MADQLSTVGGIDAVMDVSHSLLHSTSKLKLCLRTASYVPPDIEDLSRECLSFSTELRWFHKRYQKSTKEQEATHEKQGRNAHLAGLIKQCLTVKSGLKELLSRYLLIDGRPRTSYGGMDRVRWYFRRHQLMGLRFLLESAKSSVILFIVLDMAVDLQEEIKAAGTDPQKREALRRELRDTMKLSKAQVKVAQNAHQRLIEHIERSSHPSSSLIPDVRGLMRETLISERQSTRIVQQESRQFQTTSTRARQTTSSQSRNTDVQSAVRGIHSMGTTLGTTAVISREPRHSPPPSPRVYMTAAESAFRGAGYVPRTRRSKVPSPTTETHITPEPATTTEHPVAFIDPDYRPIVTAPSELLRTDDVKDDITDDPPPFPGEGYDDTLTEKKASGTVSHGRPPPPSQKLHSENRGTPEAIPPLPEEGYDETIAPQNNTDTLSYGDRPPPSYQSAVPPLPEEGYDENPTQKKAAGTVSRGDHPPPSQKLHSENKDAPESEPPLPEEEPGTTSFGNRPLPSLKPHRKTRIASESAPRLPEEGHDKPRTKIISSGSVTRGDRPPPSRKSHSKMRTADEAIAMFSEEGYDENATHKRAGGTVSHGERPPLPEDGYDEDAIPERAVGTVSKGEQPPLPEDGYDENTTHERAAGPVSHSDQPSPSQKLHSKNNGVYKALPPFVDEDFKGVRRPPSQ